MHDLQFIFRYNYSMNPSLQGKKALVIDNSSIITKIIKNFLVQTGFEKDNIFSAHDRNMAMMMFDLENFDLVTSGIHLKDSSGIELLKEIREKSNDNQKKTSFLIISSEKQETYQEILDKHQASGYLRKPFNQDQFKKTIHSILNQTDPTEPATQKSSAPYGRSPPLKFLHQSLKHLLKVRLMPWNSIWLRQRQVVQKVLLN